MKRLLLIAFLTLFLPIQGWAANTFVQFQAAIGNSTGNFGANPTTANFIGCFIYWTDDTSTLNSVTDTIGNSFTLLDNPTRNTTRHTSAAWAYAKNITGGSADSVTANMSSGVAVTINCQEWSGVDTTSPVDQHAINNTQDFAGTGGTDSVTSGSVTTTFNGAGILGIGEGAFGTSLTAGTNFTQAQLAVIPGEYKTANQVSAGSIAATFTPVGGVDDAWITGILALKATGAGSAQNFFYKRRGQ